MSFPMPPVSQPAQVAPNKALFTELPDSEQVPFSLLFGIEKMRTAMADTEKTPPEMVEEGPDIDAKSGIETLPTIALIDAPVAPKDTKTERRQQTLVESVFRPQIAFGQATRQEIPLAAQLNATAMETPIQSEIKPAIPGPMDVGKQVSTLAGAHQNAAVGSPVTLAIPRPEPIEKQSKDFQLGQLASEANAEKAPQDIRTIPTSTPQPNRPAFDAGLSFHVRDRRADISGGSFEEVTKPESKPAQTVMAPPAPQPSAIVAAPLLAQQNQQTQGDKAALIAETGDMPLVQGWGDVQTHGSLKVSHETAQLPPQPRQIAAAVAQQMAIAVSQNGPGTTEIVLSPEELGKVRMVMSTQDASITVVIHADRPETNDLLRRHIETLSQEFRNMGYSTSSFTFAQDQKDGSAKGSGTTGSGASLQTDTNETPEPDSPAVSAGLDLRL